MLSASVQLLIFFFLLIEKLKLILYFSYILQIVHIIHNYTLTDIFQFCFTLIIIAHYLRQI